MIKLEKNAYIWTLIIINLKFITLHCIKSKIKTTLDAWRKIMFMKKTTATSNFDSGIRLMTIRRQMLADSDRMFAVTILFKVDTHSWETNWAMTKAIIMLRIQIWSVRAAISNSYEFH